MNQEPDISFRPYEKPSNSYATNFVQSNFVGNQVPAENDENMPFPDNNSQNSATLAREVIL